ncbi:transmembrane protein 70, mitochondrial isoform X3 [Alligator mississippiensis]|uniref:transmembrane protein 70, mitochondrial isoform X3 n=1 Tax=Alligator mississippiensis TaxID=8496 RepID=UPI0028775E36|nr:transmembrane protein 70, mitochondrial isoform X3 [Alligator mississippiensis]
MLGSQGRELICRSSDIELSYSICDSMKHNFFFNITPCSLIGKPHWEGSIYWIPKTINTTFNIRGLTMELEKGEYTILLRGFPNYFEENLLLCLNLTMLHK